MTQVASHLIWMPQVVTVDETDKYPATLADPLVPGACRSSIFLMNNPETSIFESATGAEFGSAIARSIIYDNDLKMSIGLTLQ